MSAQPGKPRLALIAACAHDRVIGRDNRMPWHLPEDLKHFRDTTRGRPVIMGRRTWDSLPDAFRPLPGRRNLVVTRQAGLTLSGAIVAGSLPDALAAAGDPELVFVIGGADLYRQALPLADELFLTEIELDVAGDAFFPEFPEADWEEVSRRPGTSADGLRFAFVHYRRRA